MLNNNYLYEPFSVVKDLGDFYLSGLPEMTKVKLLVENVKLLFHLPQDRVEVSVSNEDRYYKITLLTKDINKIPFGMIYYMPLLKRLDIYSADSPQIPLIQWQSKKPVFKNYSMLLDTAGLDTLFKKLINVI